MIALDRLTDYILNSVNTGIMVVDLTSHVVFLNREGEEILGESLDGLRGHAIVQDDRFYPFILLVNDHRKKDPSKTTSRRQVAIDFERADGEAVKLGFTTSNLVDETGTVLGYVIVFRDLSEITSLRRAAQRSEKLAALGTMAAGVAHEIRNPLHAIRAAVELMEVKSGMGKPIDDYVKIAFDEVQRLDRLVEDILMFSRPPAVNFKAFDLNRVVKAAVQLAPEAAGVEVQLELAPDLPEARIDPDRVKQVILNLVANAVQCQPDGGRVVVSTHRAEVPLIPESVNAALDMLELRVRDEGPGIPDEDLPHLFEPFYTKRARGEGTGLGLPICQKLVEAQEGTLDVRTKVGEGTTFVVHLPVSAARPGARE